MSIRAELATAVRRVNAAYLAIPSERRPGIRLDIDDVLADALAAETAAGARRIIEEWAAGYLEMLREVSR